jgi:hypothetical protein
MAAANARLVAANSWPFLAYGAGTNTIDGVLTIHMHVINTGVGPAKIESAELVWKGVAYRRDQDFLKACCGFDPVEPDFDCEFFAARSPARGRTHNIPRIPTARRSRSVCRASAGYAEPRPATTHLLLLDFRRVLESDLTTHGLKPKPVESCVEPKVPFDQGILNGEA